VNLPSGGEIEMGLIELAGNVLDLFGAGTRIA
jgi:hypothetical protein